MIIGNAVVSLVLFGVLSSCSCEARLCDTVELKKGIQTREDFRRELSGCTEILGSLVIARVHYVNESFFDGLSFPDLKVIRDYFVMFSIEGLTSIGRLFPNLAVVGGNEYLPNTLYSIVIYFMPDLKEVCFIILGLSTMMQ